MNNEKWVTTAAAHAAPDALEIARNQILQDKAGIGHESQQDYLVTVENVTPEPENPQWWKWTDGQGWEAKGDDGEPTVSFPYGRLAITLYGTTQNRNEKLQAMKEAIHKADMP